jgi:general secretion pathway protein A
MYRQHFGFREQPFGVSPDSRFFFSSSQHAEASAALYYAIAERRGFAMLIGAPGLGKTTVLVNLAQRLVQDARVAFFVHPRFEGGAILESVLLAMGLEPESDAIRRHRQFRAFLLDLYRQGKTCVVILDEAQNLDAESLETIRMLSNFETPRQKLIQFVLAGQPALARLLRAPECEQILQRVNTIARLEPLTAPDVEKYIAHRVAAAGAARNPFLPAAVRAIAAASQGIPRNINTLCFNALTLAFAGDKKTVDETCVGEVVKDRVLEDLAPVGVGRSAPTPAVVPAPVVLATSAGVSLRAVFLTAAMFIGYLCAGAAWMWK